MKYFFTCLLAGFILVLSLTGGSRLYAQPFQRCVTDLYSEVYQEDPQIREKKAALEQYTREWIATHKNYLSTREPIRIPVVFHVVYKSAEENISDEQIYSQLVVLNEDFRALNANQDVVLPNFVSLIADTEIEFCLAEVDPAGQPTSGITRTSSSKDDIGLNSDVHYNSKGGRDAWDTKDYLNIWIADMGENVGGRATFPGEAPPAEDGVVIDSRFFGTIGTAAESQPYHLGRTTTHEVGHYLNLFHVWGQGNQSCDNDDQVEDTPPSEETYLGQCPEDYLFSCGSPDMYTNYMYYTNDACMAQFTPDQKLRMLATLFGPRLDLTLSKGCDPTHVHETETNTGLQIDIFPQPNQGLFQIRCTDCLATEAKLELYSASGTLLKTQSVYLSENTEVDVRDLPAGMYFLQIRSDQVRQVLRLIIQR